MDPTSWRIKGGLTLCQVNFQERTYNVGTRKKLTFKNKPASWLIFKYMLTIWLTSKNLTSNPEVMIKLTSMQINFKRSSLSDLKPHLLSFNSFLN